MLLLFGEKKKSYLLEQIFDQFKSTLINNVFWGKNSMLTRMIYMSLNYLSACGFQSPLTHDVGYPYKNQKVADSCRKLRAGGNPQALDFSGGKFIY